MKIQGERRFEFPRQTVWEAINDPATLSKTLPGCEKLERVEESEFRGALNVQVGPVKGLFQGSLELSHIRPPEGYHMRLQGQGPAGFMKGEGTLRLEESAGGTTLRYDMDAQVGGRIAAVGQRLVDSSARVITQQGLDGLERQLQARSGTPEGDEPRVAPAPNQKEFAAGFAKGLFAELVPAERRPLLLGVGAAILLVVAILLFRACG